MKKRSSIFSLFFSNAELLYSFTKINRLITQIYFQNLFDLRILQGIIKAVNMFVLLRTSVITQQWLLC